MPSLLLHTLVFCPNCGKEVPPEATFCASCGHSLRAQQQIPAQVPYAPQQAPKKSHLKRNILIVIGVIFLLIIVAGLASYSPTPTGNPNQIASFAITGDRTRGFTAFFWLRDAQQHNVVSDGMVSLTIYDGTNKIVYSNSFQMHASDFGEYQNVVFGGTVWGHQWSISPSQVSPSAPNALGLTYGSAKLTFTTPAGTALAYIDSFVNLGSS